MAAEWPEVPIGALGRVITGRTPSKDKPHHWGDELPFLTPTDMDGRRLVEATQRGLSQEGRKALARVVVPSGVAVSCIGWQMGKAILVDRPAATNQQINTVVPDEARVSKEFLYYALSVRRDEIFRLGAGGSRTPILKKSGFEKLPVRLPPLDEQRRIATILGALDDKIELNRKMNRTLEEMAQALFKSWFIDFDGHDDLVDSEIGPVPRGWQVRGPDAFVEFDPTIPLRKGTKAVYADMKAIPTSGPAVSDWIRREYAGGTRFQQGDTLLARITPCLENGKSALVDFLADGEVAFGSTEFIVFRPRPGVPRAWPYCLVRHEPFRAHAVANMTGSSGRQRVSSGALMGFRLAVPPAEVLRRFGAVTDPLFERITANARESRTLADLRDTLLPKLISGELRVPEAEEIVEAAS
jgi:type I restriction enzyme S subunit